MKNVLGFMMVSAPHSALNNAGLDVGSKTENIVAVKKIRKGRESYVYVSGQALRYWFRETLIHKKGWEVSPITRDKKIAFTNADPVKYADDDMFGYMRAQSSKEEGTVTRISPFKCSPLISVLPDRIVSDYGVMSRHEGDPVPYEHEFYSTVFKGIFSIDIDSSGNFTNSAKTGYRNITEKYIKSNEKSEGVIRTENGLRLKKDIRLKRITDLISIIPHLNGGAKNTSHLTDVTPKLIILMVLNGGNHILMDIAENRNGQATINTKALKEVLEDYDRDIMTDIYIGIREGFNDSLKKELEELSTEYKGSHGIKVMTPSRAVEEFIKDIPQFVD